MSQKWNEFSAESTILMRGSSRYPERVENYLQPRVPDFLYIAGNESLLREKGIGFCGSRKASDAGLEAARDCADQAAKAGFVVVSGNAAGIDLSAHHSALKAGGCTILVLPEGIERFSIKNALKDVWSWDRVLLVSQFDPNAIWKGFRAMERNKLILALSNAMIVIEASEKGGTMAAGREALRQEVPLYIVEYSKESKTMQGNRQLVQIGGRALKKNRETGRANMTRIFDDAGLGLRPNSSQIDLL